MTRKQQILLKEAIDRIDEIIDGLEANINRITAIKPGDLNQDDFLEEEAIDRLDKTLDQWLPLEILADELRAARESLYNGLLLPSIALK